MFDRMNALAELEKSIADWRWQMLAAGIKAPEPLEELELHLRDEVDQQLRLTADPAEAFAAAVQRMGDPLDLKREFSKTSGWVGRLWWVWLGIGGFGLMQTAMLNFVGPLVFHRHSSVFFSSKWWADWFPSYIAWISLVLVGSALGWVNLRAHRKALRE
jgi:hypothetical protein